MAGMRRPSEKRRALGAACKLALLALSSVAPCRAQTPALAQRGSPAPQGGELPAPPAASLNGGSDSGALARFLLERAKERFNRGVLEHDRADLESAWDVLNLGRTLTLDPAFAFNAARVARDLGRCQDARLSYQAFIEQEPSAERRQRAEQRLSELGSCADSPPSEASSVLPGETLGVMPTAAWHTLQPRLLAWDELAQAPAAESRHGERLLLWGLVGAAGVSAVLSGIFFARAASRDRALEQLPPDGQSLPETITELQAEGHTAQTRARIFGVLAAGLGAGAAIGFWWSARADESSGSGLAFLASNSGASARWQRRF